MKHILVLLFIIVPIFGTYSCSSSDNEEEIVKEAEIDDTPTEDPKIVWKNWYLSVPLNRGDGSATSIYYQAIKNNTLTTDQSQYFYKNTDGSYTFFHLLYLLTYHGLRDINQKIYW